MRKVPAARGVYVALVAFLLGLALAATGADGGEGTAAFVVFAAVALPFVLLRPPPCRADDDEDALVEACLHQGLPVETPSARIAEHFRNNRMMREELEAFTARKLRSGR